VRRLAAVLAFALCAAPGCSDEPVDEPVVKPSPYAAPTRPPKVVEPPPPLSYVDVTSASGIDFVHDTGAYGGVLLPETTGSGCAFFDYDTDGDADLLLLNGDQWPGHERDTGRPTWRMYRNDGDFRFTDVSRETGLDQSFYAMGAAVADVDSDGDLDLFVTGVCGYRFFLNDGGVFTDATSAWGLLPGTWTNPQGNEHGPFATSAAFLDYDGDGRLDLFVCHYVHWSVEDDVHATYDGETKGYATPSQYSGETSRLWRNVDGKRFDDVTEAAGVMNPRGKSLGVCVCDFDDDGHTDLLVANDTVRDYLYRNNGDGTFTDVGQEMGIAFGPDGKVRAGMGADAARLGPEGKLYLAVGNFSREPVSLWMAAGAVFKNKSDVAGVAIATLHPLTFGIRFVDVDLDGRPDLVCANGHIEPSIGRVESDNSYEQSMVLLRGLAGVKFADISEHVGADFTKQVVARGLAAADVDLDGDLDLCVTVNGGPPRLLRCDLENAAARSLRVVVKDAAGAPAIGAKVTVEVRGAVQTRWVRSGGSYLSQSEFPLTFGLGDAKKADRVTVTWPSGKTAEFTDTAAGSLVAEQ